MEELKKENAEKNAEIEKLKKEMAEKDRKIEEFGKGFNAKRKSMKKSDFAGDLFLDEVDTDGKFIKITNKSDEDISIAAWRLISTADRELIWIFNKTAKIQANKSITVWSYNYGEENNPPSNIVMKENLCWPTGEEINVELLDKECNLVAWREQNGLSKFRKIDDGIDLVKYDSNEYKLNAANCGPKMTISEEGLIAELYNPKVDGWNSVVATPSIPTLDDVDAKNPTIRFYFEVEILKIKKDGDIKMGFFGEEFHLEGCSKWVGKVQNTFGIDLSGKFFIDGSITKLGDATTLKERNVIGIGIIHYPANSSTKCFGTLNGKLLGKVELPQKFTTLKLFPAASLFRHGNAIRMIFRRGEWSFKEFGQLLK